MNPHELTQLLKKASDAINAQENFLVPSLAIKAAKAAEQFPNDTAILTASQVLGKMVENKKTFISRSEFNSIYEKLQVNGSKLGDVFASELKREDLVRGATYYNRQGEDRLDDYAMVADPILANALESAFDGRGYKPYSKKTASLAEKVCNAGLLEVGLAPKKLEAVAGQEDLILCQATYETPKGQSNVLIPIEMKGEQALFPTVFLAEANFADLTRESLVHHLVSTAGKSYKINTDHVLKVLSDVKNGPRKVASEVEMALIRLRSEKKEAPVNSVLGLMVEASAEEFAVQPEIEKSKEHYEFASRVTSQDGAARFLFSDRVVEAGRDLLIRKMAQYGYRSAQVKVFDVKESEIHYAVSVGTNAAIMAPVKVTGNSVLPPTVAIASGKIKSFSKDGIDELVKDTRPDNRMLAAASQSAGLKPTELVQQVRDAVNEGNLLKAEDAINVLGEIDKHAQKVAIAILMQSFSETGRKSDPRTGEVDELTRVASQKVSDTPVFNTYNIFFPTE